MTRNDLIKNWDVIEAFKNGEEIESRAIGCSTWCQNENPVFDFKRNEYRVKPTEEYVPFDFSDAMKLIGSSITPKKGVKEIIMITAASEIGVLFGFNPISYKDLYKDYTFRNGTPCGKLKTK